MSEEILVGLNLDKHRAEYEIEVLPGHTFTTWFDPSQNWVSVEIRDQNGALAGSSGFRITPTAPNPPEEGA